MPRLARLDIAGLLQHVIVRGIEQRDIFNDDHDRQLFVDRFSSLLSETGVRCYSCVSSWYLHGTLLSIYLLTQFPSMVKFTHATFSKT